MRRFPPAATALFVCFAASWLLPTASACTTIPELVRVYPPGIQWLAPPWGDLVTVTFEASCPPPFSSEFSAHATVTIGDGEYGAEIRVLVVPPDVP